MKFEVCHHENQKWIESLAFYASEISYFQTLLDEVKSKNTDKELLKDIKKFSEEFISSNEIIDNLLVGIKIQENIFAEYAQAKTFLFDEQMELIHERQRSAFEVLEKDFTLHKHQLYHFLSKVL